MDFLSKYKKPLLTGIIIGMAVLAVLLVLSDIRGVVKVFSDFQLRYLPLILILAPLNYLLRYIKWNYYLSQVDLKPDPTVNKYIFLSGLSMTITPGKVGELLKCYLLKEHMDAPVSTTSSIVMAERITDGIAMVILASLGSLIYVFGGWVLLFTITALIFIVVLFQMDTFFDYFTGLIGRVKFLHKASLFLVKFQRNLKKLFTLKALIYAVGIGVISWGFEGLVVYFAVKAFGGDISVLGSFFVVSISSILGAISALPGGLGVAEGSIMALLLMVGISTEMAAATTVVTRFSTLWLGVALGILGLFLAKRELEKDVNSNLSSNDGKA